MNAQQQLLPGRLSCDNVCDWEVDDRYTVALIKKHPNFHQVSGKISGNKR